MKRVVIVGSGVGGSVTANLLAKKAEKLEEDIEITVINNKDYIFYEPGLLYLIFNRMHEKELKRPLNSILNPKVKLIIDEATKIDAENNTVVTKNGKVEYDYLVVATGAKVVPEELPGLKEGGDWFYTLEGAKRLREKLAKIRKGRIVVGVAGIPHKCPVAPVEVTLMLHEYLKMRGVRDNVEIFYTYPIQRLHSLEKVAELAKKLYDEKGIKYETFFNITEVDAEKKKIITLEGSEVEYDIFIAIPPHKGADLIFNSGIGDNGGWVKTHRNTLKVEGFDNIYALGDATNLPVSKAGSVAHFEAEVVVENIVGDIEGFGVVKNYNGEAFCFIETGFNEATYIKFDFDNPPVPVKPSKLIHYTKIAYNRLFWLTARGVM